MTNADTKALSDFHVLMIIRINNQIDVCAIRAGSSASLFFLLYSHSKGMCLLQVAMETGPLHDGSAPD